MRVVAQFLTPTYTNTFQTIVKRPSGARVLTSEECWSRNKLKKEGERNSRAKAKGAEKKAEGRARKPDKSKLVVKEVVQGQEYKRLELVMTKNLGLKKLELKSKTEVKKPNLTKVERTAVMKSLILTMMNVVHVLPL